MSGETSITSMARTGPGTQHLATYWLPRALGLLAAATALLPLA